MAANRIKIKLLGTQTDAGHVKLGVFIKQLEAVKEALWHTELLISGKERTSVYYRIIDLSHNSPATIELEAVYANPPKAKAKDDLSKVTVQSFLKNLSTIRNKKNVPEDIDVRTLEAYKELGILLGDELCDIQILNGRRKVAIDERFNRHIEQVIGPDEKEYGTISGMLEAINLHNKHLFNIYPDIGPRKVACYFPERLTAVVIKGISKHVRVFGELRYKSRDRFPYAVNVEDIQILAADNELPSLSSLRGIAPNATGDLSSQEYIARLRNENW